MSAPSRRRVAREAWWATAAALMMLPSLALSVAPASAVRSVALGVVALGMGLAVIAG